MKRNQSAVKNDSKYIGNIKHKVQLLHTVLLKLILKLIVISS